MPNYNESRWRSLCWGIALALILTACASTPPAQTAGQPSPEASVQAPTYTPPEPLQVSQSEPPEDIGLRADAPLTYVVKKGDTLWDIAGYFLNKPWFWPELWYANPDIANPHLIYPGDVLHLIVVDGRPQLRRGPGPGARLSPQARVLPIADAIPTIPLDAIQQFLNGPRLVTQDELEHAPYIIDFADKHLIGSVGNLVYIGRAKEADGQNYQLVRQGEAYIDPDSGDILGYQAKSIGNVAMQKFAEISTGIISRSFQEALPGDRLLPLADTPLASNFYPRAPKQQVRGQIISVYGGVAQIGQYQIVTLNRGQTNGIRRGHVLDIYQTGHQVRDPVTNKQVLLPPLQAGTLMIFAVEDRVSFGLVMRATRAIHVLDSVRNPQ